MEYENAKTLAEVGFDVIQAFRSISQRWVEADDQKGLDVEDFVNEEDRFQLWASHLGLHQRGHASLDYRFRDAENLYVYARKILVDLLSALRSIFDDFFPDGGSSKNSDQEKVADSEDEVESDGDSLDGFDDETLAQAAFKSVIDSIDRLFKLAIKVRNPATRTGFSRAYQHERRDEDSGEGLYSSFERLGVDKRHIQHLFQLWQGNQYDESSKRTLIDRLAEANNKRRRQFAHWSHHKLNQVRRMERLMQKLTVGDVAHRPQSAMEPSASAHSKPTTATHLDHTKIDLDDNQSVYSTMSIMLPKLNDETNDEEVMEMPPVPELYLAQENLREFECPYCFTICSRRLLQSNEWRAHILKDLRPYVCTFESCNGSTQLYDSYTDWANHEIQSHGLAQSMQLEGQDQSDTSQTTALRSMSRRCPFCSDQLTGIENTQRHIAHHLIRVALFTIPRSTGIEVEVEDGHNGSNQNSWAGMKEPSTAEASEPPISSLGKLRALQRCYDDEWFDPCQQFITDPPQDAKNRAKTYRRLTEILLANFVLKADEVDTHGDPETRDCRKSLIDEVSTMMQRLDTVVERDRVHGRLRY